MWAVVAVTLALLGGFLAATEMLIRQRVEPVHTTNAYIRLFRAPPQADVMFGASPAANGFADQPGFINLAMEGDTAVGIEEKVRLFFGRGHAPRRVVVELSAAQLSEDYARQIARNPANAFAQLVDDDGRGLRVLSPIYRNELVNYWLMVIQGRPFVPLTTFRPDGARVLTGTMSPPTDGAVLKEVQGQEPMADFERSRAARALLSTLDLLAARNVQACVAVFPRLRRVREVEARFPGYGRYRAFLAEQAAKRGMAVADMSDMDAPEGYFANLYHLNHDGARAVSAAIVEKCFGAASVTLRQDN